MKTTMLPEKSDRKSPAGADIRILMDGKTGGMIHSTVPPHQTNRATVHATVSEFCVLEGHGEIWRDDGKESGVTVLVPGISIDIPESTRWKKAVRPTIEEYIKNAEQKGVSGRKAVKEAETLITKYRKQYK